jgi:TonB-linked SusC/RagA family outer membrane protein
VGQVRPANNHSRSLVDFLNHYKELKHYHIVYDELLVKEKGDSVTIQYELLNPDTALILVFTQQHALTYTRTAPGVLVIKDKGEANTASGSLSSFFPIHGRITNNKGEPLYKASIIILAKQAGTEANADGSFSIICCRGDKLYISYIGYAGKEVTVTGDAFLNITLDDAADTCDAAVVHGFPPIKPSLSTASVSTVQIDEPIVNTSIFSRIQGQVAGLNVSASGGVPGGMENVNIRGITSLGQASGWSNMPSSAPLIVIDGVPMPELAPINQVPSMLGNPADVGIAAKGFGYMYTLSPEDVESIEVQKDAAATAIYGARGANGVILIRTRRARQGRSAFSFSLTTGFGRITTAMNLMNTRQYLNMRYEAFANDTTTWQQSALSQTYDLRGMDTTRYTDFKRMMVGGTAKINNYNFGWTKGNNLFSLLLSGTWHTETSVFPGDISANRASLTGDFIYHPGKKLTLGLTGITSHTQNNWTPFNPMLGMLLAPMAPSLLNANGDLNWGDDRGSFINPLSIFRNKLVINTFNTILHTHGTYHIGNGLKAEISVGYNNLSTGEEARFPISAKNPAMPNVTGTYASALNRFVTWNLEPQLQHTYTTPGGLTIHSILGSSFLSMKNNKSSEVLDGYSRDEQLGRTGATDSTLEKTFFLYRYLSGYSRVDLAWKQKLLLSLTFRLDESSRFGQNNRLAKMGSAGSGWIIKNVDTSKIHNSILSYFKLRGSLGLTGNDMGIEDYGYMSLYQPVTTVQPYQGIQALAPTVLSNPYYQWEYTTKHELATEIGMFNKHLDITLAYYLNKSSNLLIKKPLPAQTGFSTIIGNYNATVQNSGIELEASFHKKWKNISYDATLAMAWPQNKLLRFPGLEQSAFAHNLVVGQSVTVERVKTAQGVDPQTGVFKAGDSTVAGNHDPKMLGGFNQTIRFNNHWLLQTSVEWQKKLAPYYLMYMYSYDGPGKRADGFLMNQPAELSGNHWQKPGDNATWQKFSAKPSSVANTSLDNYTGSNAQLVNASYMLLRNIRLGYEHEKAVFKKWGIKKAVFFLNGENLLMITPYKGCDPLVANPLVVPPLKVITLGITLTF